MGHLAVLINFCETTVTCSSVQCEQHFLPSMLAYPNVCKPVHLLHKESRSIEECYFKSWFVKVCWLALRWLPAVEHDQTGPASFLRRLQDGRILRLTRTKLVGWNGTRSWPNTSLWKELCPYYCRWRVCSLSFSCNDILQWGPRRRVGAGHTSQRGLSCTTESQMTSPTAS